MSNLFEISKIMLTFVSAKDNIWATISPKIRGFFLYPLRYGGRVLMSREGSPDVGLSSIRKYRSFFYYSYCLTAKNNIK